METNNFGPNPFADAWDYIKNNDGGASLALAKLSLALANHYDHPYTLAESIHPLDSKRLAIAKSMVGYYLEFRADQFVCQYEKDILRKYPNLKPPKAHGGTAPDSEKDIADLLWKLKRISLNLGKAVANHDFDDAHAEAGRLADTIEHYEKTHPARAV